jgi:formiminotetrahydrofolate cyclodeaminase
VPLAIMENCCKAIGLLQGFAAKGAVIAISDAGAGVALCKAALQGASLNVFINTRAMADKTYAAKVNQQANAMLAEYCPLADEIYINVAGRLID